MTEDVRRQSANSRTGTGVLRRVTKGAVHLGQFAVAFVLGIVVGGRQINLSSSSPVRSEPGAHQLVQTDAADTQRTSPAKPDDGPRQTDRLLSEVDLHLRHLLAERGKVEVAAKEDRIAYSLLRSRGYADDSTECRRLVNRQKQLDGTAAQLDEMISDARQLQRRLCDVLDTAGVPHSEAGLSAQLLADIRRCLSKSRVESPSGKEIPDERWNGGPDLLMKPDEPNEP